MAEIWSTAEKVAKLILKEAQSLRKVRNEVESVKTKLKSMGSTLKEADTMIDRDERFDKWVNELRDLAFRAEDVVEVFVNNATTYDVEDGCAIFHLITGCFHQISTLHKLKYEITDINGKLSKLEELSRQSPQMEIGSPRETSNRHRREIDWASSEIDEDDIVGFQKEEEKVKLWLTKEEPRGRPVVFSIWAQGGAGKSTLAHKIYKSSFVKSRFDCVAWVSVSQEYHVKDIWHAILEQVGQLTPNEEEGIVREKVKVYLKERNYLIILDDLWKPKDLDIIKDFPKSPQKKCRVLVTTRDEEVARRAGPCRLNLQPLKAKESMELFLKEVYRFSPEEIPSVPKEMKNLAREMLSKWCEGLPIAILLLGGILSSKEKDPILWGNIRDKVHSDLVNEGGLRKVLALSYNQLPYELRSCFLYFGLFPEDSVINCDRLIRLWVAEGFLDQGGDDQVEANKEDVAGEYLKRLIERSMIQVVERKSNGDPQTCRIHDLIRDLAMKEGKRAKFLSISVEKHVAGSSSWVESSSRRIALHNGTSSTAPIQSEASSSSTLQQPLRKGVRRPRDVDHHEGDDDIVGFQEEADDLARSLTKEEPLQPLVVVSILGRRGIGKTTLARKVYNRNDVKSHFGNYRAWVNIFEDCFEVKHVLRTILQQITRRLTDAEIELMEKGEKELQRMVHNLLGRKSYLIVFDNVSYRKHWQAIRMMFPKNPLNKDQKCRVLLTTQFIGLTHFANLSSSTSCFELGDLNEELRLKLLLKTIFECSSQDEIPKAILRNKKEMDTARKIVEYCRESTSMLLALGSFLSREDKKDTFLSTKWTNVLESLNNLPPTNFWFNRVFYLCYVDLPDYLASCIRYFNSLPLDSCIPCDTLTRLWVEQGFLDSVGDDGNYTILEDVARDCLEELIQRKLIDVVEWKSNGDPQTCRMPHCLHFLVCFKMKELDSERQKFHRRGGNTTRPTEETTSTTSPTAATTTTTAVPPPQHYYSQQQPCKRSSDEGTFSLSHLLSKILGDDPFKFTNHVYSFLCFSKIHPNLAALKELVLLRVVDLEGAGAENILELPIEIGNLTLLRYLGLRGTGVKVIPPWIANLRNLQTLDAPASKIPTGILDSLHQLRHLFADSFHYSPPPPPPPPPPVDNMIISCDSSSSSSSSSSINIGVLKHLHTLELLGDNGDLVIEGLDKLTNLRVLRICVDNCKDVSAITNLTGLKFLRLTRSLKADSYGSHKYNGLPLPPFSRDSCLNEMILVSFSIRFPKPTDYPTRLTLLWLDLNGGEMGTDMHIFYALEELPNLKKLCLRTLVGPGYWLLPKILTFCSTEGFPKLEYLYVRLENCIRGWDVKAGALRSLRVLHIEGKYEMGNFPTGLGHVTNLNELIITRCYNWRWSIINRQGQAWEAVKGIQASIKYFDETTENPPP